MDHVSGYYQSRSRSSISTILLAGLAAGILDGVAASVQFYIMTGKSPLRVFQYIASAVMGTSAFGGGLKTAALGLLFHFAIAIGFAAIFSFLFPWLHRLLQYPLVIGIFYGVIVWLVMNFVVVPVTKVARGPFNIRTALLGMTIIIAMVGIPISLIFSRRRKVAHAAFS